MKRPWLLLSSIALSLAMAPPSLFSTKGIVAADHHLVSRAGAEILATGGNAVDAVIASALTAGVVQPAGSGLGGGGFALVQQGTESAFCLDFRERAPASATREMFIDHPRIKASRIGGLAVAIPNESNGLLALHRKYGSLPLKKLIQPAVRLTKSFPAGAYLLRALGKLGTAESQFTADYFGLSQPIQPHQELQNPRLAKTLKSWAKTGGKSLQTGWIAEDIVKTVQADGGILSHSDLENIQAVERSVLKGQYRGWTIYTMPPPSSGGIVLLQVLAVLEHFDLVGLGHNSAELFHLYAETFQHAFADRANHLGDPDRVDVPIEQLLDKQRIKEIQNSFQATKTQEAGAYGSRLDIGEDHGTQHISVIDKDGLSVSLTSTLNTYFGSTLVAKQSGIVLNNEMDDFVAEPGKANFYGLVGSEANSVAPGAVPLSSMTPTILVSPDGSQRISIGASGGPFIISATIQTIINLIDFGLVPTEAVAASRIHHQWQPRKLFVDKDISVDTRDKLQEKGHQLQSMPLDSAVQVIFCQEGKCLSASDPRKGGRPSSPDTIQ